MDADCSNGGGDGTHGIADAVRHIHAAAMNRHREQRSAVEQQLQQGEEDDRRMPN